VLRIRIKILWDRRTEQHIARHGVKREEIEAGMLGRKFVRRTKYNRFEVICNAHGRILFVVLEPMKKGTFKPVTARDADDKEKKLYKRRAK
jgi:hypothetical protein